MHQKSVITEKLPGSLSGTDRCAHPYCDEKGTSYKISGSVKLHTDDSLRKQKCLSNIENRTKDILL